jgi:hypothetical protein
VSTPTTDPNCNGCPMQSMCELHDYYDACIVRQSGIRLPPEVADGTVSTDRKCINCRHFRPFEGACNIYPGAKENEDCCFDFEQYSSEAE